MHGGKKFPHAHWRILCVVVNLAVNYLHSFFRESPAEYDEILTNKI